MAMGKMRILFIAATFVVIGAFIYIGAHAVCQHRSDFNGGLVFIGKPVNVFGTEYYRLYMWRAANDSTALPDASVYIDGVAHPFDSLTPQLFASIMRTAVQNEGSAVDATGAWLQYRFENAQLTWFSLDAPSPGANANGPVSDVHFAIGLGKGSAFALPIGHDPLVAAAGEPQRTYLHFAQ